MTLESAITETPTTKLLSSSNNTFSVDKKYILPPEERPELYAGTCATIPVIDMKEAQIDGQERTAIVRQISKACEEFGFFQEMWETSCHSFLVQFITLSHPNSCNLIINHGVPEIMIRNMLGISKEFFEMPAENRMELYSNDRGKPVRVGTSFNMERDKVYYWRDFLRLSCHPLLDYIHLWPEKPKNYKEIAGRYAVEMRSLVLKLLGLLSEGLGLETGFLDEKFGKHNQVLVTNYYPPCPDPSLTLGLPGHSDPNGITVLLQGEVPGLQIMKEGKWIALEPIPNSFVINIGDQLEVFSNGKFKSVEHRAITNSSMARVSIATFYSPSTDSFIAPAESLVNEENPAHYRGYKFKEFFDVFWSKDLRRKAVLDCFRI